MSLDPNLMPFEGNLIRIQDHAPCGCAGKPHWVFTEDAAGALVSKVCPGRLAETPFLGEDGTLLGYRLARG